MNIDELRIVDFQHRELAFLQFGEALMVRHMAFTGEESLKKYLMHETPAHIYYSSAYYQRPQDSNMNNKEWLGADLIFDIDADHIPTSCKIDHDLWKCLDCGEEGKGFPPENCPKCGMKRIETKTWVCEKCLNVTKSEVFKIIDNYLRPDFGLSLNDIEICFSGHRGYHIHVISREVRGLGTDGRREIADYIRGIGLNLELHGFKVLSMNDPVIGPDLRDKGWRGRSVKSIYEILKNCNEEELSKIISQQTAISIYKKRDRILEKMEESPSWWGGLKPAEVKNLTAIATASIKRVACNIDERVTIDIKRLIRYPNSLHGKTGLKASRITYNDLEKFDPLRDAVAFRESSIKVYVRDIPRIRIGDKEIGPLKDAKMEVPKALGIYMICRGAAEPIE
jgi:DNA primase small subunit